MENNLQHEDLLIKLRAKLNADKIKLWEAPFYQDNSSVLSSLEELATKYSANLATSPEVTLAALQELQLHSLERSKDNAEFNETGVATLRVRVTLTGQKPKLLKVQIKLDALGSDLLSRVSSDIGMESSRIKLIHSGKVIKPTQNLEEQGLKNGVQIMALILNESVDKIQKEDRMYMEMKSTRDDATLLAESDIKGGDEDFIALENQSGQPIELPAAERRSLLVGMALAARGAAALRQRDYPLALTTLLTADTMFNECRSQILENVDNWAILQLDIAWCYLRIGSIQHCNDVHRRLHAAEVKFNATYGQGREKLTAIKGSEANERVLYMRLYLLQGVVAYHQNRREEARRLLTMAEKEVNALRVEESAVLALTELGWSVSAARAGLRANHGDLQLANSYLEKRAYRQLANRSLQHHERQQRQLGVCSDGQPVSPELVAMMIGMGHNRKAAVKALAAKNNNISEATIMIADNPEMFSENSSDESSGSLHSDDSQVEPDSGLVAELVAMGYELAQARTALKLTQNQINLAVELLVAGGGTIEAEVEACATGPSTSADTSTAKKRRVKQERKIKKNKEREEALRRLQSVLKSEEDDYIDTTLDQEDEILAQYKSLL